MVTCLILGLCFMQRREEASASRPPQMSLSCLTLFSAYIISNRLSEWNQIGFFFFLWMDHTSSGHSLIGRQCTSMDAVVCNKQLQSVLEFRFQENQRSNWSVFFKPYLGIGIRMRFSHLWMSWLQSNCRIPLCNVRSYCLGIFFLSKRWDSSLTSCVVQQPYQWPVVCNQQKSWTSHGSNQLIARINTRTLSEEEQQ